MTMVTNRSLVVVVVPEQTTTDLCVSSSYQWRHLRQPVGIPISPRSCIQARAGARRPPEQVDNEASRSRVHLCLRSPTPSRPISNTETADLHHGDRFGVRVPPRRPKVDWWLRSVLGPWRRAFYKTSQKRTLVSLVSSRWRMRS